jgi:hypothetical protein
MKTLTKIKDGIRKILFGLKKTEPQKKQQDKYRVGRSTGRAILVIETGREHLIFPFGSDESVQKYCDWLNKLENEKTGNN